MYSFFLINILQNERNNRVQKNWIFIWTNKNYEHFLIKNTYKQQ